MRGAEGANSSLSSAKGAAHIEFDLNGKLEQFQIAVQN